MALYFENIGHLAAYGIVIKSVIARKPSGMVYDYRSCNVDLRLSISGQATLAIK